MGFGRSRGSRRLRCICTEYRFQPAWLYNVAAEERGGEIAACYRYAMERVAQSFRSFEDADRADDQFYANLTPEERLDILLELVERHRSALGEAASRFERVHRITELSQR